MKLAIAVIRRIGYAIILLLTVIVLNFILIEIAPGDPVDTLVGEMGGATEEVIRQLRAEYGLDRSLPVRLAAYVGRMAAFDLGTSFTHEKKVTALILQRLPATLLLVLSAILAAIFVGTLLGVIAAQKPHGWFSHLVTVLALAGYSAPVFWTGIMLMILFSYLIPVFPSFGMQSVVGATDFWSYAKDVLHHLVLPAVTLASIYLAYYSRLARASMLDVLGSDYIRTARAKGLSRHAVVYKHALKNAVLPVVTIAGLQFSQLIAGAIVVETVFSWPGMGTLAFEAILRRDHPLLLGILFFSTFIVIIANLITDLSYRLLDPRIKEG
jgi:peptide/nickel transport system permease protein